VKHRKAPFHAGEYSSEELAKSKSVFVANLIIRRLRYYIAQDMSSKTNVPPVSTTLYLLYNVLYIGGAGYGIYGYNHISRAWFGDYFFREIFIEGAESVFTPFSRAGIRRLFRWFDTKVPIPGP
jgi:hypothetical protein